MAWAVRVVDATGSTNADLAAAARAGERGPRVLAAREQTAGRGRLGRSWASAPGGSLSASVLWAPAVPQAAWTWLPVVVGLAVLDAVGALGARVGTGAGGVALKWPNDVVVVQEAPEPSPGPSPAPSPEPSPGAGPPVGARTGLAKLAGVLCEVVVGPAGPVVVLGAGLNLADPDPSLAGAGTTSLATVLGRPAGLDEVLPVLVDALEARLGAWERAGGDAARSGVEQDYRRVCTTLGRRVRAVAPGGVHEGTAVDLDPDGSLVLEPAGVEGPGLRVRVAAGDVEHLR